MWTGGEQPGISLQTQTGTDPWTKTAAEGARVECVLFAESMPCPGGNASRASSKLLAALLFALKEVSRIRFTKERLVCTDVLQVWKDHINEKQTQWHSHYPHKKRIMPDQAFSEKLGIPEIFLTKAVLPTLLVTCLDFLNRILIFFTSSILLGES